MGLQRDVSVISPLQIARRQNTLRFYLTHTRIQWSVGGCVAPAE